MDKNTQERFDKLLRELSETNHLLRAVAQPREDCEDTVNDKYESNDDGDERSARSLVSSDPRPRPKKGGKPKTKWYKALLWCKPPLEIIGIVAAIIYAGITFRQWRDANTNFRSSQRAWVGLDIKDSEEAIFVGEAGRDTTSLIHIRNYGGSPALHLLIHGRLCICPKQAVNWESIQEEVEHLDMGKRGATEDTLFNGQDLPDFTRTPHPMSDQDIQEVASGAIRLIVEERITYDDIFNNPHETTICLQYAPPHPNDIPFPGRAHWASCPIQEKAT